MRFKGARAEFWQQMECADRRPTEPGDVAFDADSFYRAVTEGIDPTGKALQTLMPRWSLTRTESDTLAAYLNTLQ